VTVYTNTLEKLQRELARKKQRPVVVYFSPSCDTFQPIPEVLELAYQTFEFLLREGIGISILTKGVMPEKHLVLLARYATLVRVQVGITTLDPEIASRLEPGAASPEVRLAQIGHLIAAGIETQARFDPIIPGVKDDDATIDRLCTELARRGICRIAASTLFLRPVILQSLQRALHGTPLLDRMLQPFASRQRLGIHAEGSSVTALPPVMREAMYGRIRTIAERHGITMRICACKNPDIASGSCQITGRWDNSQVRQLQPKLFG
jgi:DNA repair photolyase